VLFWSGDTADLIEEEGEDEKGKEESEGSNTHAEQAWVHPRIEGSGELEILVMHN